MASTRRLERLNALFKEVLGKIILETIEVGQGELITITEISTTEDLLQTTVWVSILPEERAKIIFEKLGHAIGSIQHDFIRAVRMHPVPKIVFRLDSTEGRAQNIYRLLRQTDEDGGALES